MPVIALIQNSNDLTRVESSILEHAGYRVIELGSAADIISVLSEQPIELYIINLPLSFVNGHALTRLIRMSDTVAGIILHDDGNDSISNGLNQGADLCFVKPVSGETLLAATNSLYQRIFSQSNSHCLHGLDLRDTAER